MTVDATTVAARPASGALPSARPGPAGHRRGRLFGIAAGQVVTVQTAVALVVAAVGHRPLTLVGAVLAAALLTGAALVRVHGRWAYEWAGVAVGYAARRHALPTGARPGALLELLRPDARVVPAELGADAAAVIADGSGLTAVVEVGDSTGLVAEALPAWPSPAALLPPAGPDSPPTRVQFILTGVAAPALRAGSGTAATSYRQLTEGRLLGHARAVLVMRVQRADGWSDADLHRTLSGLVRKLPRRLGGVPVRPLGEAATLDVLAELAHHDPAHPVRETWSAVHLGGLVQATYRLRRWPDLRVETARRLVTRLLGLPTTATTVAVAAGSGLPGAPGAVAVDLTVRLAAPTEAALASADQALQKLVAGEGGRLRRLDGAHLPGLAATLPLGGDPDVAPPDRATDPRPGRDDARAGRDDARAGDAASTTDVLAGLDLSAGVAGLMVGNNRHGAPVVARLFRPEPTRVLLVGGVGTAQLVTLRAMGLGARVVVQTARPQVWEPFVRGAGVPGESIAVVPAGRMLDVPAGTALLPLLVVVDVGPVGADPGPGRGWQATLVLRDDFGAVDVDLAARADLLIMQHLQPDQAALVGTALGLGAAASWLGRIRQDMVAVINRRSVRWALLSPTPIESQLTGVHHRPARAAAAG